MSTVMRDCRKSATATSERPIAIGIRAPMRSVSRPAIGAATMITTVEGRNRMPASSGE